MHALSEILGQPTPDIPSTPEDNLPPISPTAALWYEILLDLPWYKGLTAPKSLDEIRCRNPALVVAESTLRGRIKGELEPYGIENKKKIGYRIKPSRRPPQK
jgi:hypothetical protein